MSKLFLLSAEEANKLPLKMLDCGKWWWLRSPGIVANSAMSVDDQGYVIDSFNYVGNTFISVRPAIYIKTGLFDTLDRTKKGYVRLGTKLNPNCEPTKSIKWIDISAYIGEPYLLMKKPIEQYRFDGVSNDYDKSEIKARLSQLDTVLFTDYEESLLEDWENKYG